MFDQLVYAAFPFRNKCFDYSLGFPRGEAWVHKTTLTRDNLLKCLYQARKVKGHVFVC